PGGLGRPVAVVKIDNTAPSHPQVGVQAADVVYVEEVEGGLTRLAAVFSSKLPDVVGPVRSARTNDVELFAQYGHIAIVYAGANRGVEATVAAAPLANIAPDAAGGGWFRGLGRHAPYNLFYRLASQIPARHDVAKVKSIGFVFGPPVPAASRLAHAIQARFSSFASIGFVWDPTHHAWLQSMDGSPSYTLSGSRVSAT